MAKSRTDTEAVIKLVINGEQAKTSAKELTDAYRRFNSELTNMKKADDPKAYLEKAKNVRVLKSAMEEAKREAAGLSNESNKLATNWKTIAAGVVGANVFQTIAASAIGAIVKIKDAYAETQKFRAVLTNAFKGDGDMANNALKMLNDFAANTPYSLTSATESYIKLVNRGIVPTKAELIKLGDVAASQGKELNMFVEAVLDAQTGENERLKEFGIHASKNGDKVAFTFKGITKEVDNTAAAISKALIEFGELEGVKGTMESVAQTIVGLESNIDDSWGQIFTKLGQKSEGFLYNFYKTYSDTLGFINERILGTKTEADALTESWITQAEIVQKLEKETVPMLDRYDQLQSKAKLSKEEQTELKEIIAKIAEVIPSAVTEFDKYGVALGINTGKSREFIETQKVMMEYWNKTAIKEQESELRSLESRQKIYQSMLKFRKVEKISGAGTVESRDMTNEEISRIRKNLEETTKEAERTKTIINELKGGNLELVKKALEPPTPTGGTPTLGGPSADELKKREAAAEKARKKLEALRADIASWQNKAESGDEGADKELVAIENKYQELLKKAIGHEDEITKIKETRAELRGQRLTEIDLKNEKNSRKNAIDQLKGSYAEEDLIRSQNLQSRLTAIDASDKNEVDKAAARTAQIAEFELESYNSKQERLIAEALLIEAQIEAYDLEMEEEQQLADRKMELQKQVADNAIAQQQRAADFSKEIYQDRIESEKELQDAVYDAVSTGFNLMSGLFEENSAAAKAFFILEKVAAAAKVILMMTQELAAIRLATASQIAMASLTGQPWLIPIIKASGMAQSLTAKINAGIGIATIGSQSFATGGILPSGPSHSQGGINLVDNITGAVVGEIEGGEPILSKETYRNNKPTIDALLYASSRRMGANIALDGGRIATGERMYRSGGIIERTNKPNSQQSSTSVNIDMSELKHLMGEMIDAVREEKTRPAVLSYKELLRTDEEYNRIANNQNA